MIQLHKHVFNNNYCEADMKSVNITEWENAEVFDGTSDGNVLTTTTLKV